MRVRPRSPLNLPEIGKTCTPQVVGWIQDFCAWLGVERGLSPKTVTTYLSDLKSFFLFLSTYRGEKITEEALCTLTRQDFRAFLAKRQREGVSARLCARSTSALRTFFHCLKKHEAQGAIKAYMHEGDLPASVALDRLRARKLPKLLPRPLERDKALSFQDLPDDTWLDARDRALFVLLYGTGMRIGEVLALNQKDLPCVWQADTCLRFVGKRNKEREVPLLEPVHQALQTYLSRLPYPGAAEKPLFYGARGGRLLASTAATVMAKLRGYLGLTGKATPHTLRHSFATHLMDEGVSLRHIQALLGHASLSSTQIYTDVSLARMQEIYQKAHPHAKSVKK